MENFPCLSLNIVNDMEFDQHESGVLRISPEEHSGVMPRHVG